MKAILTAINAQYIHTNLAVRSIQSYLVQQGISNSKILEFNINQPLDMMLERLALEQADVYMFSCYLWNIDIVCKLAAELRKLNGRVRLIAGGPQVSYGGKRFLDANPAFDAVVMGEGELACADLLTQAPDEWELISGICCRNKNDKTKAVKLIDVNRIPFAYADLDDLPKERIVYYESMRGCPYRCTYCLAALSGEVRYRSVELVKSDMDRFLRAGVKQVKYVDRTFNCDKNRALEIWNYIAERDNGISNFHFELSGELIDDETVEFIKSVRFGLFQFEIGVQSTNRDTLAAINRSANTARLFENVQKLQNTEKVHIHLDLIAGLPYEGYEVFKESFNRVAALGPHQLQLGFLKVLDGSAIKEKADEYGMLYRSFAPFEVLQTRWIGYEELCGLKRIATVVDRFYNSGRFSHLLRELVGHFDTPFEFYEALASYYEVEGGNERPLGKLGQYELLGSFASAHRLGPTERMQWLCRLDMALHEKPRGIPKWVEVDGARPHRERVLAFYENETVRLEVLPNSAGVSPKLLLKTAHVEVLPFNPETGQAEEYAILFDYSRRDVAGHAVSNRIELPLV